MTTTVKPFMPLAKLAEQSLPPHPPAPPRQPQQDASVSPTATTKPDDGEKALQAIIARRPRELARELLAASDQVMDDEQFTLTHMTQQAHVYAVLDLADAIRAHAGLTTREVPAATISEPVTVPVVEHINGNAPHVEDEGTALVVIEHEKEEKK